MIQFNPLTIKQWRRFRSIKRGFWSAVLLLCLMVLSCCAEVLINKRAVVVSFEGQLYFPTYANFFPGKTFGLDYEYETNYRELQEIFNQQNDGNWVWLPLVPYDPYENDLKELEYPPYAPSLRDKHYLGTDSTGRDVVARLVYGFRLAMGFALFLLISQYVIGVAVGCAMGYWGGIFDLFFQRIIEIWNNVPFLYVIMIVASIVVPGFWTLMLVMVIFGWTGMTWYMRTSTYKEKAREYVSAARALGASAPRVVFSHILPNTISIIVTFIPFSIAGGITSLTALDYLGFGLPPPTPSWGELLAQGTSNLETPWIVSSVVVAMVSVLLMVTYVGEAIREAFDPKQFTYYE